MASTAADPRGAADTPMMRQYLEFKAQVPDAILMYRMGDFYEMFFDDAVKAAEILELTLTSRNKNDPQPIPMAGVPHHALEPYLVRLAAAGFKVAVANQVESPAETRARGEKLVAREIVRVVTPGIPWNSDAIDARERCWLAGVSQRSASNGPFGLALLDISTGELRVTELPDAVSLARELALHDPRELVLHPAVVDLPELCHLSSEASASTKTPVSVPEPAFFDRSAATARLCEVLKVADLVGFGARELGPGLDAAGALIAYARDTARVDLSHVNSLDVYSVEGRMVLDAATMRNLEVLRPLWGSGRQGTLLGLLDESCTAMGGRLLRDWLSAPLTTAGAIQTRLDAVETLLQPSLRRDLRLHLRQVADIERLAGKVAQATAHARDLVALCTSLRALPQLHELLSLQPALALGVPRDPCGDVADDIGHWVVEQPPTALTEGGLLRRGRHAELDEVVSLAREGKGAIARMEARERDRTGISSLKIKHNRVFGYFLEVTNANRDRVPDDWMRKQTLANAERYITSELKDFEEKVLGADERRKSLEYALFVDLRDRVACQVSRLQAVARQLAWLDVVASLAEVADNQRYCRPVIDDSQRLELLAARHPVVEAMPMDEPFVPNDIVMDSDRRLVILTGPNMAGKSTVMRQVALCVLMAQIGAFVPATKAHIGLCDRIFVRVGASDDLAHGRSTFMVEMSETAFILNQATPRSLVLLDEIGRGTSTYDGLSIAWAVAEAMHDRVQARTIFATHYHELVSLADERPHVCNRHIAVSVWGDRIIFLRRLEEGGASQSYGIQCARLAGMPAPVVKRARELLAELERRPRHGPPTQQLGLFAPPAPIVGAAAPAPAARSPVLSPVEAALAAADPDALTPRAALELIYQLKTLTRPA